MICNKCPSPKGLGHNLFTFVFFSGGHATSNMPLLFVSVQYLPYLLVEYGIVICKPLRYVFMHRGLGNVVVFGSGADGSAGFNHVHSQLAGSFFQRF